jgi:hypothetical protein
LLQCLLLPPLLLLLALLLPLVHSCAAAAEGLSAVHRGRSIAPARTCWAVFA